MALFSDRLKRNEIILPYVISAMWKDIDNHTGNDSNIADTAILSRFLEQDMAQYQNVENKENYRDLFHPSQAMRCMRQQWLERKGAGQFMENNDVEGTLRVLRIFSNGDYTHLRWMVLFERLGILEAREIPFHSPDDRMCGKADGIVNINGKRILFDIKSARASSANKMLKEGSPGESYIYQIQTYMAVFDVPYGAIIVENKDDQTAAEYSFELDRSFHSKVLERKDMLFDFLESDMLPPCEGESLNYPPCKWCDFALVCRSESKLLDLVKKAEKEKIHALTKKMSACLEAVRKRGREGAKV